MTMLGGNSSMEIDTGDVNNDGYPDFVTSHQSGTVWINNGDGTFASGDYNLPRGGSFDYPKGVSLGDYNRDGFDDVVFVNADDGIDLWTWDQENTLWVDQSGNLPAVAFVETTRLYDMNGDGRLDIVAFGDGVLAVFVESSPGDWELETYVTVPSPGYYAALRIADADHNGYPDFALLSEQGSIFNRQNHLRFFREDSQASSPTIRVVSPTTQRVVRDGSVWFVDWEAGVPADDTDSAQVKLELSLAGPAGPWSSIAEELPNNGRYQTNLTIGESSSNCYIRATLTTEAGNATRTHGPFEIITP